MSQESIFVCISGPCREQCSGETKQALQETIERYKLNNQLNIYPVGCMGFCGEGPVILSEAEAICYKWVSPDMAHKVVDNYIKSKNLIYSK